MRVSQGGRGGIFSRDDPLPLWSGELDLEILHRVALCDEYFSILYNGGLFSYIFFCIPKYLQFLCAG